MGYRSDVTAIVYSTHKPFGVDSFYALDKENKYPLLKTLMNTTFKDITEMWGNHLKWYDKDGLLVFKVDDIKWYDHDKDIEAFETFLLQEVERCGFEFEFARVGENHDDIETHASSHALGLLQVETIVRIDI